jgi:photosystem II stability/assembly factor-like uncharacterized protein
MGSNTLANSLCIDGGTVWITGNGGWYSFDESEGRHTFYTALMKSVQNPAFPDSWGMYSSWTPVETTGITGGIGTMVKSGGSYYALANGGIASSVDGVTWNTVFTPTNNLHSLATNGSGGFVAVGGNSSPTEHDADLPGGAPYLVYSTDGTTWHPVNVASIFSDGYIRDVAYGNGKFVAVGQRGKMAVSANGGSTWQAIAKSTFSNVENINTVAYGDGLFLMAGDNGKIDYYDTTSATPVVFAAQQIGSGIYHASYGRDLFIVSTGDNNIYYSWRAGYPQPSPTPPPPPTPVVGTVHDWSEATASPSTASYYNGPMATGPMLLTLGNYPAISIDDGKTWTVNKYNNIGITAQTLLYAPQSYVRPAYLPNVTAFWAAGTRVSGTSVLRTSKDGSSWTEVKDPLTTGTNTITDMAYAEINGYADLLFVTVGANGTTPQICYSWGGTAWTKSATTPLQPLKAVIYAVGDFIAVGGKPGTPYMLRSEDLGNTWQEINVSSVFAGACILDIVYTSGMYVAVGEKGKMAYSNNNGNTWTAITGSTFLASEKINTVTVATSNSIFIMAGDNGKINYFNPYVTDHATSVYASEQITGAGAFKYAIFVDGRPILTTEAHNTGAKTGIHYGTPRPH